MVEKVLGLPHGTRPVVVISKHEESPHREFYKTDYDHGRRAPIHYATNILEKEADLDDETFFRTFFLVALATHLTPGTGNMVPLEYLGSLEVASKVCEYAWGDQILKDVMTEIDTFQKKKKKALLDGAFKKIWVGSCLPLVAVLQDTHIEQPQPPGPKETPNTRFWKEAIAYADEVEKSVTKTTQNNQDVASTSAPGANQSTSEEETRRRIPDSYKDPGLSILPPGKTCTQVCTQPPPLAHQDQDADTFTSPPVTKHSTSDEETLRRVLDSYDDPSFSLLPPGQTWTQAFAEPPPSTHEGEIADASTTVVQTTAAGPTTMATVDANLAHISHESSLVHAPTPTSPTQLTQAKLSVPEDKFVATNCLREFNNAYQDGSLKSKDLLYFAIPHKQHWILCCINLLYKHINIFDSDKKLKNDEVYELSNNLVTNFVTLATHAKAFKKLDFMKFTCFNPPDCPQQKTHFDCGIFTMLFMKQWDGKNMANFSKITMASSSSSKDKLFERVINPYLPEVMKHPQTIEMRDGVLYIPDVQGSKKTGTMEARLEAVEHEIFRCQGMVERGLGTNHSMITEFTYYLKVYGKPLEDNPQRANQFSARPNLRSSKPNL
ncbi:40S ribosomal protein S5-1 [Hordeum vulgare]|nr:40S ribosomal protein S5-1 [Hordeum vulgare]